MPGRQLFIISFLILNNSSLTHVGVRLALGGVCSPSIRRLKCWIASRVENTTSSASVDTSDQLKTCRGEIEINIAYLNAAKNPAGLCIFLFRLVVWEVQPLTISSASCLFLTHNCCPLYFNISSFSQGTPVICMTLKLIRNNICISIVLCLSKTTQVATMSSLSVKLYIHNPQSAYNFT